MTASVSTLDATAGEYTFIKNVAFRRNLVAALVDEHQQQQRQQQHQHDSTISSAALSSSLLVDAIRANPEMAHPNWTQDEMMRTKPCHTSWMESRLPASVWAPPPRQMPTPLVALPTAGGIIPQLPTMSLSGCPFGLQFQDVVSVQHRSH